MSFSSPVSKSSLNPVEGRGASRILLSSSAMRSFETISMRSRFAAMASYEGGALHVRLGDSSLRFKLQPGEAIIYPSDTFHEVEPVTKGERLVAITFIESQVSDPFRRNLLFDLNEVAALEGLNMAPENFSRLQLVQQCLLRHWADKP